MTPCPAPDAITRAAAEPDEVPPEILEHLASCSRCREILERAEPPVNWDWLADTQPNHEPKPRFLDRLKAAVRYTVTGPAEQDDVGLSIPGYAIEAEIARGGMGVVYLAKDLALGRAVAIKVLRPDLATNTGQLSRFIGEAKALAALQHPNVVQLFHVGESTGHHYLVMEYVPGGTLRHAMKSDLWEPVAAARLIRTLADATAAVHRIGVIHRDLKPGNVLMSAVRDLSTEGTTANRPKVADFGLARFVNEANPQTRTGDIFGTPEFMSPEQARGDHRKVGPETDVWALGVILYELLTGRVPFVGETSFDTLELVKSSPVVPPELVRPGISRDLAAITSKCLEKKPHRRYRTAVALRDDLDLFLAGRPVSAYPRSWVGRVISEIRRRPWAAIRWSLLAVIVSGSLGLAGWQWNKGRSTASITTAELVRLREQHDTTIRELYATRIAIVARALAAGHIADAETWLAMCRPTAGDPDARGWEWNYLSNRLHGPAQIDLRLADTDRHGFDDVKLVPNSEATSPDQRRRVVIDPAGRLAIYDLDGRFLLEMPTVPGRIIGVRFSKDGRWLAVRTSDDAVVAFDGLAP